MFQNLLTLFFTVCLSAELKLNGGTAITQIKWIPWLDKVNIKPNLLNITVTGGSRVLCLTLVIGSTIRQDIITESYFNSFLLQ